MSDTSKSGWPLTLDLLAGLAAALALTLSLRAWLATSQAWVSGALAVYVVLAAMVYGFWNAGRIRACRREDFGWANRITLVRAVLVAVLAGVLVLPETVQGHGAVFAVMAVAALALDGLDGWIARRVDGTTRFGARFDMEVDALLILVLSIAVVLADRAGPWVLAIGGMRYAFVAAGLAWPWLRRELPPSRWRKFVCVVQGFVLAAALLPWMPLAAVEISLVLALAGLAYSFVRDALWLRRHRRRQDP